MSSNDEVVREVLVWECPRDEGKNYTAMPVSENHRYGCVHCGHDWDTDSVASSSWQLARSVDCIDCNGTGIVLVGYVRRCGLCQWSDAELAYEPGTMVLYVPGWADHDAKHSSVGSGVVVGKLGRQDSVFVCYATEGGMQSTAQLTPKAYLYLYRWASLDWAHSFVEERKIL